MPVHAAKRLFKPLILVLLVFLTLFGLFLLLHQTSPSSTSEHFANIKSHEKIWKILQPNEENIRKDASNNGDNLAEAKISNFIEKHIELKRPIEKNEKKYKAKSSRKLERIVKRKKSQAEDGKQIKNYPKYYEDDLHPDWVFKISRTYDERRLHHWTEPNYTVPKSELWTQGENGHGFVSKSPEEEAEMKEMLAKHKYNLYASEHISVRRSLPDYRYPECRNLTYPDRLPNASVIIVMHNEAWTTILRTIWSIIDRSPRKLLHEIIIVDDVSTWDFLKRPLGDYIDVLPVRVRILRTTRREGLIRARLIGARKATGSILVFFDAHMECVRGWLEPIAARIANDRSVVAVPMIDGISSHDMSYGAAFKTVVSVLRWHLIFTWVDISKQELQRTKGDRTAPIRAPTHVGCAFAMDREFFFEIGSYDTGMDIWGGENVELAFRVWLCGGSLEIIPCSKVGHLFRISTYSFDGDQSEITARNNKRLVEVWMDEFKELYYAANPRSRTVSPGDLTERKELRKQLKCKNFRWYLENIYPQSTWLKKYNLLGEFKSVSADMCLDIDSTALNGKLKVWPCHKLGGNQFFAFERNGLIVTVEEICVGVNSEKEVILVNCTDEDKTKLWDYDKERQWIINKASGLCMRNQHRDVILAKCDASDNHFQWAFESTDVNNVTKIL